MRIGGRDGVQCLSTILSWSCCPRCALRYVGIDDEPLYAKSQQDIHAHICQMTKDINEREKEKGTDVTDIIITEYQDKKCVACVGILQDDYCSESFVREVASVKRAAGHDADTFFLPISFPVTMTLRNHSIWICLSELYPELYEKDMLENIVTVKEVWRWLHLKTLGNEIKAEYNKDSPLKINLNFEHPDSQKECSFLLDAHSNHFRKRKNAGDVFNRTNVFNAVRKMANEDFKKNYQSPPRVLDKRCTCDIQCSHDPIYMAGRYNKYSRELSQTVWLIDGERKTDSSIEELICVPILPHVGADKYVFTSSGREDVDVKMLGSGRPFIIELNNPRKTKMTQADVTKVQDEINSKTKDIAVRYLQLVPKESTTKIKDGEMEKVKCYSAVCWSERPVTQKELDELEQITELELKQKTPIRVLHRRAPATRLKVIHSMRTELLNDHHFLLHMQTQAGTYIKEFVHSDMGRTAPSVGSLLKNTRCDILELNVEAVLLDWPDPVEEGKINSTNGAISLTEEKHAPATN